MDVIGDEEKGVRLDLEANSAESLPQGKDDEHKATFKSFKYVVSYICREPWLQDSTSRGFCDAVNILEAPYNN
jgi:hypothetical protein